MRLAGDSPEGMWVERGDRTRADKQTLENRNNDRTDKGKRPKKKGRDVPWDTTRCIKIRNEKYTFGFAT